MDADTLIEHLAVVGPLLASAASAAGWDAPVPRLDWDVSTLVRHVGGVHRWATAVITQRPKDEVEAADAATGAGAGPQGEALVDWFLDGHAALVAALRAAPDDLDAFTFLAADSPRHFWARRQTHETTVHLVDALGAAQRDESIDPELAQDGIAELAAGFATRRGFAIARAATVRLDASDGPSWLLAFGGERNLATKDGSGHADATVTGTSDQLYRWVWNRPSRAQVGGDVSAADAWAAAVKIVWS